MQTQLTRPGVLPSVLLESVGWKAEAVRRVSFDNVAWRAVLVTDENGPVGALCFNEPDVYPHLVVDAVVMHPERAGSTAQMAEMLAAALPVVRACAAKFKATRIVFDTTSLMLRQVLAAYGAQEESVSLSIGLTDMDHIAIIAPEPIAQEVSEYGVFTSPCGRVAKSKAGQVGHERHCAKCKEGG